jgi:HD-like signal output (HDOD) protein
MLEKLPQTILSSVATITLPPLPQVLVRFLALAEDDSATPADLAALVALDPDFTEQILSGTSTPP